MDVDDHQDVSTRSYGYDVVTPSAGGHVKDNRMVGKVVLAKKMADPSAFTLCSVNLQKLIFPIGFLVTNDIVFSG